MASVKTLIALARAKYSTEAALARALGVPQSHITDWRKGTRPMSGESAAALCDLLELTGEECREWVAVAMIENPKNAGRAEMLRRALFACWALGVAALMQPNDAKARTGDYTARVDSLYIVAHWLAFGLRRIARLRRAALRVSSFGDSPMSFGMGPIRFGTKAVTV